MMGILDRIGAEALGIRTTKPGHLLCGADLGDGSVCMVPAHVKHVHSRNVAESGQQETDDLLTRADRMVPARGLQETNARFLAAQKALGETLAATPEEVAALADKARALFAPPSAVETADRQRPLPDWSNEYKLRHTLGRPALARRLCEALEPNDAAELAEVLDGLFERRMTEVQRAVAEVTEETLARLHEDAQAKLREVRNERFGRGSRLD